jgi:Delta24(24(1))-sterol reductase
MTPKVGAKDLSDSFLESTPSRRRKTAKSQIVENSRDRKEDSAANGSANGTAKKPAEKPRIIDGWAEGLDPKIDHSGILDFGGSWGTLAMMTGFPLLMYYMWIGVAYYDGQLPLRSPGQSWPDFIVHLARLVYVGAYPSLKAWTIYWAFIIFEAICCIMLPGVTIHGRPLRYLGGKQLSYHCSAVWSFYVTLVTALALQFSGLFKLSTVIDEFGPLMCVAILSGFLVSFIAYFSALVRGAEHRMTGYPIYDFFMGAELNPRMFGILDFKLFFEVRLPWYILLLVSMGTAAKQYEQYGYVSGEVAFLVMAHFLYANACSKGEECIVSTW